MYDLTFHNYFLVNFENDFFCEWHWIYRYVYGHIEMKSNKRKCTVNEYSEKIRYYYMEERKILLHHIRLFIAVSKIYFVRIHSYTHSHIYGRVSGKVFCNRKYCKKVKGAVIISLFYFQTFTSISWFPKISTNSNTLWKFHRITLNLGRVFKDQISILNREIYNFTLIIIFF